MRLGGPRLWLPVAVVAADQLTKAWVVAYFADRADPVRVGALLNLVHVRNYGVGFGLLGGGGATQQWVLAAFACAVAALLLVMQTRPDLRRHALGLTLIAGGAIGNAVCRITRGSVVDFVDLHVRGFHWPAFNVADAAITVGALLVAVGALPLGRAVGRLGKPPRGR